MKTNKKNKKRNHTFDIGLMPNIIIHKELGSGIYSVPDIAFILNLPLGKVRRWLSEFWDARLGNKMQKKYSWGEGRNKSTNFYTLIEFYIFYKMREQNISVNRILTLHNELSEKLKTPYPFASTSVLYDGKEIFYQLHDGDKTTVRTKRKDQIVFKEIIERFCQKIDFSENENIAERFWPLGKEKNVVVDPHHQFGQPVIDNTNILTETIYNLYKAGESIPFLSRLYNLNKNDVEAAIEFYNRNAA